MGCIFLISFRRPLLRYDANSNSLFFIIIGGESEMSGAGFELHPMPIIHDSCEMKNWQQTREK